MKSLKILVASSLLLPLTGAIEANTISCEPLRLSGQCAIKPTDSTPAPFGIHDVLTVSAGSSHCFTFENLPDESVYEVGDVIDTQNGRVKLFEYRINGGPPQTDVNFAMVQQSVLAGGSGHELWMQRVNPQVKLDVPVSRVTALIAENRSGTGAHHNIGVNGRRLVIDGSLENAHGWVIGPANGSQIRIDVAMEPEDAREGAWRRGIVQLEAIQGEIRKFSLGSLNAKIDNLCTIE